MHADILRVDANKPGKVSIPLHFVNEEKCHGVKIEGGIIEHLLVELEVQCLPKDIPEYIEVDMLDVTTADIIHISDLKLPEGVVSTALALGEDHDMAVASVSAKRGGAADDLEDDAIDGGEAATEEDGGEEGGDE